MKNPSTLRLSLDLFSIVYENFRNIKEPDDFNRLIPYRTIEVKDEIIGNTKEVPEDFYEIRYYLMPKIKVLATIDTGYHKDSGLVNFNTLIEISSFFSKFEFNSIYRKHIMKYVREKTNCEQWLNINKENYYMIDQNSSLFLNTRLAGKWIGLSIIELQYSGYELFTK